MQKHGRARRALVGVAALSCAATATLMASPPIASGAGGPPRATGAVSTTNAMQQFDQDIQTLGGTRYSTAFGGLWQSATGVTHIDIARGTLSYPAIEASAFASLVTQLAPKGVTGSIEITTVDHPFSALASLTQSIANDQTKLAAEGVSMASWGPNPAANTVSVSVQNFTSSKDQALFDAMFGTGWVTVTPDAFVGVPRRTTNRLSDYAPFYGGDIIWNTPTYDEANKCTDAFNYVGNSSGDTFMLTAGHCVSVGQTIYTNLSSRRTDVPHMRMGFCVPHHW